MTGEHRELTVAGPAGTRPAPLRRLSGGLRRVAIRGPTDQRRLRDDRSAAERRGDDREDGRRRAPPEGGGDPG